MDTVEVPSKVLRDVPRLARATALLLAGAAVHLWLFPFPTTPGRSRLLDRLTAGVTSVARAGAIATPGGDAGVVASTLGAVVPPSAATNGRMTNDSPGETLDRVNVLIETVHPITILSPIPSRPAGLGNAVLRTVLAPAPAVREGLFTAVPDEPAMSIELPAIAHPNETHALDTPVRQPRPMVPSPLLSDLAEPVAGAAHTAGRREATRRVDGGSDETLVGDVLQQYREAYESLDVSAAQTIWPTVDARALGAAFRQLAGQRVTFDSCGVSVSGSGSQATARCTGQAQYVPKVGSRRAYTASGEWVFDLQKDNAAWRIINANANIK